MGTHVDLLELPYFQGISMNDLVSVVDLMEPVQYRAGSAIVTEGAPHPSPLYIATEGRVVISKAGPDGKARRLADLASPTLFGEIELFCQIRPVCSAIAVTAVQAFTLDRPTYDKLFASRHPAILQFTFNVARVASHRLALADGVLAQLLTDEDLCNLRRSVWSSMHGDRQSMEMTGAFRRIDFVEKG